MYRNPLTLHGWKWIHLERNTNLGLRRAQHGRLRCTGVLRFIIPRRELQVNRQQQDCFRYAGARLQIFNGRAQVLRVSRTGRADRFLRDAVQASSSQHPALAGNFARRIVTRALRSSAWIQKRSGRMRKITILSFAKER